MYSTQELIKMSVTKGKLNQLFTETLSEIDQKHIAIYDGSPLDLPTILDNLNERDILVTNDNYIDEKCDFMVINKQGKIILDVNNDGSTINDLDQKDYLKEDTCEELATIYDKLRRSDAVCVVSEVA